MSLKEPLFDRCALCLAEADDRFVDWFGYRVHNGCLADLEYERKDD